MKNSFFLNPYYVQKIKSSIVLFVFSMAIISCTKENNPADDTPASKCNGRYDKDIFATVRTTSNVEYGT
jgi:hypothetical protein